MKIIVLLILSLLLSLFPMQAIAADESTEKYECLLAFGYETLEELQADLITKAQLNAVDEFFGALIVSSTAVENAVVTSDSIRMSSMGYVHLKGNAQFENGSQLGQICVTVSFEVTDKDREIFEPIEISARECVNDSNLTTRQLREYGQKRAIIKALVDHDPRLSNTAEESLLQLMRNIKYPESEVLKDTDTFCATVEGKVVPAELEAILELGDVDLSTDYQVKNNSYNDEFDGPDLNKNWVWQREDPSRWSLDEEPGQLRIYAVGGDFVFSCNNSQNLLLQHAPKDDFAIVTRVTAQPTKNYQLGGLIAFQDLDNWVKLDVVWSDGLNGQGIELIVEQDGKLVPDWPNWPKKSMKLPSDGIYLKLSKTQQTYEGSYSLDGNSWTKLGSLPAPKITNPDVGLLALGGITSEQGSPNCAFTAPEIPVDFEFFHVELPKPDKSTEKGPVSGTTLFQDDFNDGDDAGWISDPASWKVIREQYVCVSQEGRAYRNDDSWSDFSVSAKARPFAGSLDVGILGRVQDEEHFYMAQLYGSAAYLYRREGGWITLNSANYQTSLGSSYVVKMEFDATEIRMFVNDELILTAEDAKYLSGGIGLRCAGGAQAAFDDVVVESLTK